MLACPRKYIVPLLLLWFLIWGICPWDISSAAAQPLEAAHTRHGHQATEDTHHASKGSEHSCSGAVSFTKNDLQKDKHLLQTVASVDCSVLTDLTRHVPSTGPLPLSFSDTGVLPKLLSDFYQLYSNYRI